MGSISPTSMKCAVFKVELDITPLCPAGHLLRKGGDWLSSTAAANLPLAGEMSGRAEGGAKENKRPETISKVRLFFGIVFR
jgi:hypothetical protein